MFSQDRKVTDSEDRLAVIEDKWFGLLPRNLAWGEGDVKWLVGETKRLRAENEKLEAAWRDAEDRVLETDRVVALLIGLLRKLRHADPPTPDLVVAVDEVLHDPNL